MFGALPWWSLNVEDVQRLYFGNFSRTTAKTGVTNNNTAEVAETEKWWLGTE